MRKNRIAPARRWLRNDLDCYPLNGSALQLGIALAVVAAALLDPMQAAIAATGLVGVVLIEAGVHPRPAGRLAGILRRYGGREHGGAGCRWRCGRSRLGGRGGGRCGRRRSRRSRCAGEAFLAEVGVFLVADRAGRLHPVPFVVAGLQAQRTRGSSAEHDAGADRGSIKRDELVHGITSLIPLGRDRLAHWLGPASCSTRLEPPDRRKLSLASRHRHEGPRPHYFRATRSTRAAIPT